MNSVMYSVCFAMVSVRIGSISYLHVSAAHSIVLHTQAWRKGLIVQQPKPTGEDCMVVTRHKRALLAFQQVSFSAAFLVTLERWATNTQNPSDNSVPFVFPKWSQWTQNVDSWEESTMSLFAIFHNTKAKARGRNIFSYNYFRCWQGSPPSIIWPMSKNCCIATLTFSEHKALTNLCVQGKSVRRSSSNCGKPVNSCVASLLVISPVVKHCLKLMQ